MADALRTFRLVCRPGEEALVEELLRAQGFEFSEEPFYPLARKLEKEPFPLGGSLAARFGRIYIQDRSSMLPPVALNPPAGACVLDMCSAPGSKTSMLAGMVGPSGFVFGSEPSADRIGTLRANLRRTCSFNSATAKAEAQALPFAAGSWNYIQLDPPCSGWGTVEKNPKVLELWTPEKTRPLVDLQRILLRRACELLAPGGVVVFSTCTTNVMENEEQAAWAVQELGLVPEPLAEPAGFVFDAPHAPCHDGVLRVSDDSEGQGFFLARFRKEGGEVAVPQSNHSLPGEAVQPWKMKNSENMDFDAMPPGVYMNFNGKVYFLHQEALARVTPGMRWQGFALGKTGGKGAKAAFRPDATARCLLPARENMPNSAALDADTPEELEMLLSGRGLPASKGSGPAGLYFRGLPLGWVARKGTRFLWQEKG